MLLCVSTHSSGTSRPQPGVQIAPLGVVSQSQGRRFDLPNNAGFVFHIPVLTYIYCCLLLGDL